MTKQATKNSTRQSHMALTEGIHSLQIPESERDGETQQMINAITNS